MRVHRYQNQYVKLQAGAPILHVPVLESCHAQLKNSQHIFIVYCFMRHFMRLYIYMLAPPQDPYFHMLAFPKTYNTVHPVHLACLEAKYLVPEGFTVLRIFFFNRALPGSSC